MRRNFAATGPGDLHIDVPLSNVAINHRPTGMIADMIAPMVPVTKQSDGFVEFSRADALRIEDDRRAPGAEARVVTRDISSHTYFANDHALKDRVTVEDRANMDPILLQELYNNRVTYITGKLMLGWEHRVSAQVTSGSNVGSYSAVSSAWTDEANSDPIGDLHTAIDNVHDSVGLRPNRIVIGDKAWRSLRRHTDILNRIFGTNNGGGYPSTAQVANLLEIDQILVGRAYYNAGEEGDAESLTPVWGDDVLVYYAPSAPSREEPSFMYSFRWNVPGVPSMQAERHGYDSKTKSEEVEVGYYQDEKVVGSAYGYLLTAVNSST